MTDVQLLRHIADVARHRFGLHVWQWLPGPVGGHSATSLHYQAFPAHRTGRAFDAYGTGVLGRLREARFARWLKKSHKARLTEGIYHGRWTTLSIKRGHTVPSSYWGLATWDAHKTHVHVAI
jgi:hypothetical protein